MITLSSHVASSEPHNSERWALFALFYRWGNREKSGMTCIVTHLMSDSAGTWVPLFWGKPCPFHQLPLPLTLTVVKTKSTSSTWVLRVSRAGLHAKWEYNKCHHILSHLPCARCGLGHVTDMCSVFTTILHDRCFLFHTWRNRLKRGRNN